MEEREATKAVQEMLGLAYKKAEELTKSKTEAEIEWKLSTECREALDSVSDACKRASSGFTNVVTGLAIKACCPDVDVRYHQAQIGAPFSFRGVSEKGVYPWLSSKEFEGAKSGWQTRTYERPKPYTLDYDENIAYIKKPFLQLYDCLETSDEDPIEALVYLFVKQIALRNKRQIVLACPMVNDIGRIVDFFERHFFNKYSSKGGARLPVLAIYSIYTVLLKELNRYDGMSLRELQEHSAADSQTGSVGDIEVVDVEGALYEAVEIKHDIPVNSIVPTSLFKKIAPHGVRRFYWLTTHQDCKCDEGQRGELEALGGRIGCQIIVNGVMASISYYLRLLREPCSIFPEYCRLVGEDRALAHEHRVVWNEIVQNA